MGSGGETSRLDVGSGVAGLSGGSGSDGGTKSTRGADDRGGAGGGFNTGSSIGRVAVGCRSMTGGVGGVTSIGIVLLLLDLLSKPPAGVTPVESCAGIA